MALAGGGPDDHVRAFMRGNLTGVSSQSRQEMRWLTLWLLQRRWEWRQIGERQAIGEGLGLGIDPSDWEAGAGLCQRAARRLFRHASVWFQKVLCSKVRNSLQGRWMQSPEVKQSRQGAASAPCRRDFHG